MFSKRPKIRIRIRTLTALLVVVLLLGCAAGGTLAWLVTKSASVTNTFVSGNIGTLTLAETSGNSYVVTPGVNITKDPKVTFQGNNIPAYIFLKVEADGWNVTGSGTAYTYSIGNSQQMKWELNGWTKVVDGVYYKEAAANSGVQAWDIINGNTITVSSSITSADISDYAKNLAFTAYAIQQEGFATVEAAWAQAQNLG